MSDTTRRFPRFLSQRSIPGEVKATIAKLGADPSGTARERKNMRLPDGRVLSHVANSTIGNIRDARNLFQVLPDMDYARQILISATLSPGDLTDTKILYSVKDDSLDTNLTGPLLRKVQDFFDNSYRIRSLLHPMLNDVMFETGSYPVLIMPEASIDRIINADSYGGVSMESAISQLDGHLREETDGAGNYLPWGILGNAKQDKRNVDSYTGVSFESLTFEGANSYNRNVDISNLKFSLESFSNDFDTGEEGVKAKAKLAELGRTMQKALTDKGSTIQVMDNLHILKRPMVVETRRKIAVRRIYGGKLHRRASLESRAENGDQNAQRNLNAVEKSLYNKRRYAHIPVQPVMTLAQTGAETYGHPLVMHLPSESVIPIHVPGNPSEHVGYYVMLDIDGNPISVANQNSYHDDIKAQLNNADSYASQIIQQARRGFEGMGGMENEIIEEMGRIHSEAVEADLLTRLRSGALSGNYELGKTEHINRIMLARHLKGQKTVMLFVPPELMTYVAFDYNEYGVGKSILEDGKILGSIRAALMLANTLATINNAVGGKTIEINLDPDDEDPVSTVEFLLSEHAKVNATGFSRIVGSTHPLGLADQIQNHGVNVVVQGNTRYPETSYNVNSRDGTSKPVDTELEEMMRKRHIQMFGLSPEVMEGMNQTDFATTVVQNNLMLLKRVIQNQEKFEPFLTDIVRRYVLNSGHFLEDMRELVKANAQYLPDELKNNKQLSDEDRVDTFLFDFIQALLVGLPSPEVGDIKKSMDSFDAYSEALDKVIDSYMNEEMFATDTTIGMEELIPNIKAVVKAEFQRRWLRMNNVMPELDIFNTVTEEDGSPAFDLLEATGDHLDGLNNAVSEYVKKVVKTAKKRAKVLEKIAKEKAALEEVKNASSGTDEMDGGMDDDNADLEAGGEEGLDDLDAEGGEGEDLDLDAEDGEGLDGLEEGAEVEGLDAEAEAGDDSEAELETSETADAETLDAEVDADGELDIAATDAETDVPEEAADPVEAEEEVEDLTAATDATEPSIDIADIPLEEEEVETPDAAEPDLDVPAEPEVEEVVADEPDVEEPELETEVEEEVETPEVPDVEEPAAEEEEELPDVEVEEETPEADAVEEEEVGSTPEPETEETEEAAETDEEKTDAAVKAAEDEAEKHKKEAEEAEDDLELPDIEPPKV